ncbi:MAG: hypothetical protein JWP01_1067 [Myxococcales bacterium]|nr:hypothetical protein [Myxococcales bacterium]
MPPVGCLWFNDRVVTNARDREAFDEALARGSDQLKQGKLDQAQRSFRVALEHDPDNLRVLAMLGLTYFRGNQFSDARPIYEQLAEKSPTDASHRLNLGLVYLKVNESELAINALEASRALDPSQNRAVSYLGLAYARAGRYAEAYRSFLLAGQNELASEIEINLTPAERDGINQKLGRTPPPRPEPDPAPAIARTETPPAISRAATPRTQPPSAPPKSAPKLADDAAAAAFSQQLSHPEIVIERLAADQPSAPMVPARSGASVVESPVSTLFAHASTAPGAPVEPQRFTESMQFVLPKSDGAPIQPHAGISMISQAVAAAAPSTTASTAERTKAGNIPPRPLSELATDELIRPDVGDDPFEITQNGALIIRVTDRVMTRLDGIHVTGGDLSYELAMRRSRGHQTDDPFDYGGTPLHTVSGDGYLIAVPGKSTFHAVSLDDDILYLREDLVFAFEGSLRWESGNVPGMRGMLPVVQFRGDGSLVVRVARPLVRVKLPAQGVVYVDADRLAGWIGRVIPRAVVPPSGGPMGQMCVECTGEGIVLMEPRGEATMTVAQVAAPISAPRTKPPSAPPAAIVASEPDPEMDMSSVAGDDPDAPSEAVKAAAAEGPSGDPEAAIDALDRLEES